MKKTIALLLVLICGISMSAVCQGVNSPQPGKYYLTTMEMDGADMKEFFKELGMDVDDMCIELQSGGKFTMSFMGDIKNGAYKMAGNNITMSSGDDEDMIARIEGNKIIMEEEGDPETSGFSSSKLVFEKK